jgi:16S rRNA (adenine1518-N6/adenine1519-N6)-dimethyltransferase
MDISTKKGIVKLSKELNIYPHKKWGQNFLVDKNILNKIVDYCQIGDQDYVIEIGPGLGSLTRQLTKRSKAVLAVEIDTGLKPALEAVLKDANNYYIKYADILQINLEEELSKAFGLKEAIEYKVCANIPYNITSPIIFKLLEECDNLSFAVLMMQKEVAQRIKAQPHSKDYGLLSIMVKYYAEVNYLMDISRNCFYPAPEVDSALVKITPRKNKYAVKNEKLFKLLVKKAFQMRRKTILNICNNVFGLEKSIIEEHLNQLNINCNSRPENLSINDFINIADNINHYQE